MSHTSLQLLAATDICVKDCSMPGFTPGVLHISAGLIALETAAQNTLLISPIELWQSGRMPLHRVVSMPTMLTHGCSQ